MKNDLNHDHAIDFDDDPIFIEDMEESFMDFCEIGKPNQVAGSMNNQSNVVPVSAVLSLREAPSFPDKKFPWGVEGS